MSPAEGYITSGERQYVISDAVSKRVFSVMRRLKNSAKRNFVGTIFVDVEVHLYNVLIDGEGANPMSI